MDLALETLQPKMRLSGKIVKTTLAGAVVDIGLKIPGVIHISQLRKEPVNRVEDVVRVGQDVDVWVRRVRDDRVELTMIQPLALELKEIRPDMLVKGKVERLESYGAFVDIGTERPGLVHISEISHEYIKTPAEVLKVGDEVEVKVLDVDRRKKQIRLSIKAAQVKEEKPAQEIAQGQEMVKGKRSRKGDQQSQAPAESEEQEPELTAIEIAYREALARANGENVDLSKERKTANRKNRADENEEILARTLKNRLPTG